MTRFRRLRWVGAGVVTVVLAVSAAAAVAASAGGPAEHRSASAGCYPKGSTTIAQDKAGRFFHISGLRGGSWYVCAFEQGAPRKLGGFKNPDASKPVRPSARAAGRYVAFFLNGVGGSGVAVFDMVTGHSAFLERSPLATSNSLVLKPDGSVAWASSTGRGWDVNRHDSTGTTVVDSGPGIDPHSLAAGGSWLYWTNAASPRSAPFR